jgi:hypothetical protein
LSTYLKLFRNLLKTFEILENIKLYAYSTQNLKSKNINILASLESLKGSHMLKACLERPLYNCLEFKPKNLKNTIFNFEYISEII